MTPALKKYKQNALGFGFACLIILYLWSGWAALTWMDKRDKQAFMAVEQVGCQTLTEKTNE